MSHDHHLEKHGQMIGIFPKSPSELMNNTGISQHGNANHNLAHAGHSTEQGHWMTMWFHGGYEEVILFDFWRINSVTGNKMIILLPKMWKHLWQNCQRLLLSCLGVFLLATVYEGMKWFRVYLQTVYESRLLMTRRRSLLGNNDSGSSHESHSNPMDKNTIPSVQTQNSAVNLSLLQILSTVLYMAQLTLAYWLMLIVMTYNVYLGICVILGAGCGHIIFASLSCLQQKMATNLNFNDHCH